MKKIYIYITQRKKRNDFAKNGISVMQRMQNLLDRFPCLFFIDNGTLLGIIRDGKLLKRDMDIDIGVYLENEKQVDDLIKYLISNDCIHTHHFWVENIGSIQDTFELNGVRVDICYYRKGDDRDTFYVLYDCNCGRGKVVKFSCIPLTGVKLIQFNNIFVNVPSDSEDFLENRYGESWRIPDPHFIYWEGPSVVEIDNNGFYKEFD